MNFHQIATKLDYFNNIIIFKWIFPFYEVQSTDHSQFCCNSIKIKISICNNRKWNFENSWKLSFFECPLLWAKFCMKKSGILEKRISITQATGQRILIWFIKHQPNIHRRLLLGGNSQKKCYGPFFIEWNFSGEYWNSFYNSTYYINNYFLFHTFYQSSIYIELTKTRFL